MEPWLDELSLPTRRPRKGCSRRTRIILLVLIVAILLCCLGGRWLVGRQEQRQRFLQRQYTPIAPPPRITRVVVPPGGAMPTPTCTPSAAGTGG